MGPSVTMMTSSYSGQDLWQRLNLSFGQKSLQGYYYGTYRHQFAVVLGEYGSKFEIQQDLDLHVDLSAYMHGCESDESQMQHAPVDNWIYWCWNPSSADTGGLVDNDWSTILWNKVDKLIDDFDLQPWFFGPYYMDASHCEQSEWPGNHPIELPPLDIEFPL